MKKSAILILCLCLLLTACGSQPNFPVAGGGAVQDQQVKQVMEMIDSLGEITLESIDRLGEVQAAHNALTDNQANNVSNYQTLLDAWDAYYTLAVVNEWHAAPNAWEFAYDSEPDLTLSQDGTFRNPDREGTWKVENRQVILEGEYTETFTILDEDGEITIKDWAERKLIPLADYQAQTEDAFLEVDLSNADLSRYLGFAEYEYAIYDAWDEPTGEVYTTVLFTNKLYEQGWIFWGTDDEMQFEVNIPGYTVTYQPVEGAASTNEEQPETELIRHYELVFAGESAGVSIYPYDRKTNYETVTTDLNLEEITFGRARGTIIFLNKKFVKEIKESNGQRCIVIQVGEDTREVEWGDWWENHPY